MRQIRVEDFGFPSQGQSDSIVRRERAPTDAGHVDARFVPLASKGFTEVSALHPAFIVRAAAGRAAPTATLGGISAAQQMGANRALQPLPPDPSLFNVTEEGCMVGTERLCGLMPQPPYTSVFVSSPSSAGLNIDKDFTTCETDLIEQAWGLMKDEENLELLEWAACMGTAAPHKGNCLRNKIEDATLWSDITVTRTTDCDFDAQVPLATLNWLRICADDDRLFDRATSAFCLRSDQLEQECALVMMAAAIAHELVHLCYRSSSDDECDCRVSCLTESYFAHALLERYPKAAQSDCCAYALSQAWDSSCRTAIMNDCGDVYTCPPGPGGGGPTLPPPTLLPPIIHQDPGWILILDGVQVTFSM